jgi:hypothetical protein
VVVNDREFRQRIAELLARQKREDAEQAAAKKPPACEHPKAAVRRKKA